MIVFHKPCNRDCHGRKPYRLIPGSKQSYRYISRAGSMQIASEVPLIGDDIAGPQQTPPVIIPSKTRNGPRWAELGLFQADLSPISSACFMSRSCALLLDSLSHPLASVSHLTPYGTYFT